jgi:hypothetical protein
MITFNVMTSGQIKDYVIGICVFTKKHTAQRSKNKESESE